MKERLLITTAVGLMLGTGAFAQSPSDPPKTNPPPAAQSQTNPSSSAPAASSSTTTPSSTPSAQNAQPTPSGTAKSTTTTSQTAPNTTNPASQPAQAQSGTSTTTTPSQAQSTTQPSNSPAQAQTNTAPPATNQSQAAPGTNTNTNAGAQPPANTAAQPATNQTNTAQSTSSNVSVSASLNETQRTRVTESISRLNVEPINNVNFSLSVGTVVPRDVRFQPLPTDVVEVMPQYRGYNFFVVRDDIVVVDPTSYRIVDVLPRTGRATAAAPVAPAPQAAAPVAPAQRKMTFSDKDREVIRKHARSSRVEQRTTGSVASTRVRVGERLPESVEIRTFPDEVHRQSPALREYRYLERDNRTYVVEPRERTIIEEID